MTKTNLGIRLLYANSGKEVQDIIDSDPAMHDPKNWHFLDGRDTNINIIGNLSKKGGKAATELITNMVDAILTKRCHEEGINPKSSEAPETMYKAVDKFITPLNGGKIVKADDAWLRSYSKKNLIIGITGNRKANGIHPCYVFCDNGEGQSPKNFAKTFLSLSAKNKSEIPFVQGKYNMGSSGVLNFCGFKLILSRRYNEEGPWGWTLIRKNTPTAGNTYAEYFAIGQSENISTIEDKQIFPLMEKQRYDGFSLNTGTVIKLYEYFVDMKIPGFKETRETLNESMVETILPFQIYDCRWTPDKNRGGMRGYGIDSRSFFGLGFHLLRNLKEEVDDSDSTETDIESENSALLPIDKIHDARLGDILISAIVLKKDDKTDKWTRKYNSRVFHHVNGQVQYKETKGALSKCKFGALKDRIVIFVDSSGLYDSTHQVIWAGNREDVIQNEKGVLYLRTVEDSIKNSNALKQINHRIEQDMMKSITQESSKEVVKDLIKRDKHFAVLLEGGVPGVSVGGEHAKQEEPRTDLKHSPTYIKLYGKARQTPVPINKSRLINCDTDAVNDFLNRSDNRGDVVFSDDQIENKFSCRTYLHNGKLLISIKPIKSECSEGDKFNFKIGLFDPAMPNPQYTEELEVEISEPTEKTVQPTPTPKPLKSKQAGLPSMILVTKDGRNFSDDKPTKSWQEAKDFGCVEFNEKDGGFCYYNTDKKPIYFINCDNSFLLSYLSSSKTDSNKTRYTEKYILGMRIMLLSLENTLKLSEQHITDTHGKNCSEVQDEIRRQAAAGSASVVLLLSETLPGSFNQNDKDDDDE